MNSDFTVAVHALVFLGLRGERLSSEALAESICTNPARVRKVIAKLHRAGLVDTREGSEGGCRLAVAPEAVNLAQVADALETVFVESAWRSGDPERDCPVCAGMGALMDELLFELDSACRARLRELTLADLGRKLLADAQA